MKDALNDSIGGVRGMLDMSDEIAAVKRAFHNDEEPEYVVWLTIAGALLIGLILMFMVTNQSNISTAGDTTLTYPSTWTKVDEADASFAAADRDSYYSFGPRASVRQLDKATLAPVPITGGEPTDQDNLQFAAANWSLQRQSQIVGYRTLSVVTTTVQGKPAVVIESAYLLDSALGGGGLPGLMRSADTIVLNGDTFDILNFATQSSDWSDQSALRDRLLKGWKLP
ncbi:MAG: hypothetical protein ABIQ44_00995 [Chloroflexia bacterium]